ncbi:MAG: hypothetical protein ACREXR_08150, partial [Gammaproteobacteria bacterium]
RKRLRIEQNPGQVTEGAADNWTDRAICTGIIGVWIKHAIEQINQCRFREGDAFVQYLDSYIRFSCLNEPA